MVQKRRSHFLYRYILPHTGLLIVKIISLTCRVRIVDPDNELRFTDRGKGLIYISWHQRFFPGITFFARRKPIAIMISESRDGEFIAHIVKILGWEPVRGSSAHGGRQALSKLNKLALDGYRIGHIVDGPKGPFGEVKPGLLKIAQTTGLPIVPTITSAQKRWSVNSWDQFMVPKFFSRVIIRFGKPIFVPADIDAARFEKKRRQIENQLKRLYQETDRIWNDPEKIKRIFKLRLKMRILSNVRLGKS